MRGPRKANTENWDFDGKTITVRIPMTFARCGGRKVIQLDTLVYPHQQCLVVPVGERQVGRNGVVASVTGFPAIAVPGGFSKPTATAPIGVPVGIEFLGRPWSEPVLIRIAYAFEQATRFHRPPPSTPPLK